MNTLELFGQVLHYIGWAFLPFLLLPFLVLIFSNNGFLRNLMVGVCGILNAFNCRTGEVVKWLLVALVISVAFSVIALSIFGLSWTKLDESAIYFHAIVIFLGSAATLLAGDHVRVDIFYAKMSARAKALVDFYCFYALLVPFCLVLIWGSQSYVALAWMSLEGSAESDGIKGLFLLKTLIPVFGVMMLTQGLSIAGCAALLINGQAQPDLPRGLTPLFEAHDHEDNPL